MYNTLEVENKFRKARLITNPQERTNMQGAKPNVQIVKDAVYNWNNPKELYEKYNPSTISNVRCAVRAIIKQYINSGEWAPLPYTMPYNTKGAVCVIEEGYQYLTDLFEGNIGMIFEFRKGPNKSKKQKISKAINTGTKAATNVVALNTASQSIEPDESIKTVKYFNNNLSLELAVLKSDIVKYNLTREQIIEQLNNLK